MRGRLRCTKLHWCTSCVSVTEDQTTQRLETYLDGVLADTKSVPEFNGLVTGARNNLAVISRKGHAQNILCVANKSPGCGTTEENKQNIVGDQNCHITDTWKLSLNTSMASYNLGVISLCLYVEQIIMDFQQLNQLYVPTYLVRSHRRRVESQAPDRANCPSEEMTTSLTKWEWPLRERWGVP